MMRASLFVTSLIAAFPSQTDAETCDFTQETVSKACWLAEVSAQYNKGLDEACKDVGGQLSPGQTRATCSLGQFPNTKWTREGLVGMVDGASGGETTGLSGFSVITGTQGQIVFVPWDQLQQEMPRVEALMAPSTDAANPGEATIPTMMQTPDGLLIMR